MKKKCIFFVTYFVFLHNCLSQIDILPVYKIPIGNSIQKIKIFEDQGGLDFDIDQNNNLYLLDYVNGKIKVYNQNSEYKYKIGIESDKIERINILQNKLICLTSQYYLIIMEMTGQVLFKFQLDLREAYLTQSTFIDNYVLIPEQGASFFNLNKSVYQIKFETDSLSNKITANLIPYDKIVNASDISRQKQFLPIEEEYQKYLSKLQEPYIDYIDSEHIVFTQPEIRDEKGPRGEPVYYIFLKKELVSKKIGIFPWEIVGDCYIGGYGVGCRIHGNNLYRISVKYSKKGRIPRMPEYVIISKIDLNILKNLPNVEPEWKY
jgi:hypothetical protein